MATFDDLVAEAEAADVEGWGFSWLSGRATEERPPWRYSRLMAARMASAGAALDVQTGGGEVLAEVAHRPPLLVATESWPPNLAIARRNLRPLRAWVVGVANAPSLPFRRESFDLVVSRHPVNTLWEEIARVLTPGGTYLSQQVGAGTVHELTEAMLGPTPVSQGRNAGRAAASAVAAGLEMVDLQRATLRAVFDDIGAVVYFLRKVIWIVPEFSVERYRKQLCALHERITADGPFVAHTQRFLIEARKPA